MVYSKRKEIAPCGSKFFPFRVDPFSEGMVSRDSLPSADSRKTIVIFGQKNVNKYWLTA